MLNKKDFNWRIGGEAGYGIMSAGSVFSKTCLRSGYFVFDFNEHPSLIRGGHNSYTIRASDQEIDSPVQSVDFLVALNTETINFHQEYLSKRAAIIINTDKVDIKKVKLSRSLKIFPIPLIKLAQEAGGKEIMMNNVALGASIALLKGEFEVLTLTIKEILSGKSKKIIDLNIKAAQSGFSFIKNNFKDSSLDFSLSKKKALKKILISGGEAISLGAIKAGLKFFACYPMTPINSILSYLAKKGPSMKLVYLQPEDEISGINMAIGASLAGVRSMVATSGGGFALMTEAYGLAGMTETPLVIIEGQRPGPATGLPTWQGQGDLRFVLHAAQDDFLRIVLAPGDIEECFWLTIEAFNLADIYQTPVVILVDKHLLQDHQSIDFFDTSKVKIDRGFLLTPREQQKKYQRYQITQTGISPRAIPGRKGFTFLANSDEHNQFGVSDEGAQNRINQIEKRDRKLQTLVKKMPQPKVYGDQQASITLVSWGSSKGAILEAQKILKQNKIKTNFLHLNYLNPFPIKFVSKFLQSAKNILMVEQNISAQGTGLIREKTGINITNRLLKYDGRELFPEDIIKKVKEMVK